MRPSSEVPLSEEMAFAASWVVAVSTKPMPRERPVSRPVITAADIASPKRAKAPRRPSLEVENERPPTNSFTDMTCSFRLPGRLPRVYIRPGTATSTRWRGSSARISRSRSVARGSGGGGGQQQTDRGQRERDEHGLRKDLTRLPLELAGGPRIAHGLRSGRRFAQPARGQARSRPAAGLEEAEGGAEHGQKQHDARAARGAEQDEAGGEEQRERESRRAHEVAPAPPARSEIRDQGEGHRGPRAKVSSLPTGVAEC